MIVLPVTIPRDVELSASTNVPWEGETSPSSSAGCSWAAPPMSRQCTAGQAAASPAAALGSETRTGDSPAATGAAGSPGMWPAGA